MSYSLIFVQVSHNAFHGFHENIYEIRFIDLNKHVFEM
jgi:hypothetical protein